MNQVNQALDLLNLLALLNLLQDMFYSEKQKSKFTRRFLGLCIVVAVIVLSFSGGLYFGSHRADSGLVNSGGGEVESKDLPPPYLLQDVDFKMFWEVWHFVKEKYLEQPVLDTQLFYGAISGIVNALGDPYSVFLDPELTQEFTQELAGTFEGIGAEIGIKKGQLTIIAPLPETPADRAGLRAGDFILKIDDQDTAGMPLEIAVSNIRGQKGSTVALTILRGGWKEPRKVPIVRDKINVQSVTWKEQQDGIAYLKIVYFNENTIPNFEEAVRAILARDPKGIVLDLRNNPGGFLEVGVRVASEWIDPAEIVVIQESQGSQKTVFRAEGSARLRGIPTVVLLNTGSASASEIVAGALRDHGAATLVGENTFGKGSVQIFERMRNGASVKLTVAHWLTPNGEKINGEGLAPDIVVEMTREDVDNSDDPQLEKAMELLSK